MLYRCSTVARLASNQEDSVRDRGRVPAGCTSAWPDYLPWKEEDVGSNPTTLTNLEMRRPGFESRRGLRLLSSRGRTP